MSGSGDPTLPIFSPDPKRFSFEYEKNVVRFFYLVFKKISMNVFNFETKNTLCLYLILKHWIFNQTFCFCL